MSQPSIIIQTETTATGLQLLHKVCTIAAKAHQPNPSPVDIKQELAALNLDELLVTLSQIQDVLHNNHIKYTPFKFGS